MSKILLFGDICPTKDYRPLFDKGRIFSDEILEDIKSADFVVGNLECPATDSNKPIDKTGPCLKSMPGDLKMLASVGFNAFSLANNHILDYGSTGVKDTLLNLNDNELAYFGAGVNKEAASKPLIVRIGNHRVAFLSFAEAEFNLATADSPGANHFDPYESFDVIKRIKSEVDYLLVLYHGGIEYYQYPSPLVQKKCRKMIDSGADFVAIQHSHCIGTVETYNNGTIIYGQGNSVFGVRHNSPTWNKGLLVEIDLESGLLKYKPISASSNGIAYSDKQEALNVLRDFHSRSAKLIDNGWIHRSWTDFCYKQRALILPQLFGKSKWFNRLNRLFANKLMDILYSRFSKMVTLNLLRCEAHHEVITTLLGKEIKKA